MDKIEAYAVELVSSGAEHAAEDDLDEEGQFDNEADWLQAMKLASTMATAIKRYPNSFLAWHRTVTTDG